MRYSAVIFDMDGTILDTLEDLKNAINYALTKNGYSARTSDEIREFLGSGIRSLLLMAMPTGVSEEEIEKVQSTYAAYYKEHCSVFTKPYDGIIKMISELKDAGVKTAVVSNKADFAVKILSNQYFDGLFYFAIGENEKGGINKKPSPDMVNMILSDLNIQKKDAVFVGDSDVDIYTAKNSGIDCISVKWGFRSEEFLIEHGAKTIVGKPEEIKNIVLG